MDNEYQIGEDMHDTIMIICRLRKKFKNNWPDENSPGREVALQSLKTEVLKVLKEFQTKWPGEFTWPDELEKAESEGKRREFVEDLIISKAERLI
jgi:hypothetical protein